jgi:methionine-gamma-lyase
MASPMTGWMLMRSLETLKLRMVRKVHYLGILDEPAQQAIFHAQCLSPGAMLTFEVRGRRAGGLPIPQRAASW